MLVELKYDVKKKVGSLSERIKYLTTKSELDKPYGASPKITENLHFNLSLIISHIIFNLNFVERSKKVFTTIIDDYNENNETSLTFDDFYEISWIRIINDEILLPGFVQRFIFQVGYYEKEGQPIEIPEGLEDLVRCLQIYYQNCFDDSKLTISKEKVEYILADFARKEVTVDFLVNRGIIAESADQNIFHWNHNDYSRYLGNEIASILWLLVGGIGATGSDFRKFIKLIEESQLCYDDLGGYLGHLDTAKICELAVKFLNEEQDLELSEKEVDKIWLDAQHNRSMEINTVAPKATFNYDSTFEYIKSMKRHALKFRDVFDYQFTRGLYSSVVRLIAYNDDKYKLPYHNCLNAVTETSRPFVVWYLYREIPDRFPQVIPYLLSNYELLPIAFEHISKLEISSSFLSQQTDYDTRIKESSDIKNQLWLTMFDLTLEQFTSASYQNIDQGLIIAKILVELAEDVYCTPSNKNSALSHQPLKERFEKVFKKLKSKRVYPTDGSPRQAINPRYVFSILPSVVEYIRQEIDNGKPKKTEFINVSSGLFALCIEVLKLLNLRRPQFEISTDLEAKISDSKNKLVSLIESYLSSFYSVTYIEVHSYSSECPDEKLVERGYNEFGFEILDWGYLFLTLNKQQRLESLHSSFLNSLIFDNGKTKSDTQNKEQGEKVNLYLKSLMLSFISISSNKELYEIEGLPVSETFNLVQGWISELAITYSAYELSDTKMDVFEEVFALYGHDIYYKSSITLLFECLNYFPEVKQMEFVRNFFSNSIDVGRMIEALNVLDSKEVCCIISKSIQGVKIEKFINSCHTINDIKSALVQAINSEAHWELAQPLMEDIQNHIKKRRIRNESMDSLLFEVNLLLAFKEKDFNKLKALSPKESNDQIVKRQRFNLKEFYIALFRLYNEENYDWAINILKRLHSTDTKNIRYAYHLYRAETLKFTENRADKDLLYRANREWEQFVENLDANERGGLLGFSELLNLNNLYYYAENKDSFRFDQTINSLSNRYLYTEEIIPVVYEFYINRGLHELACDYINKAEEFFYENGVIIPAHIQGIIESSESPHLLRRLKLSLEQIQSLTPKSLPRITPSIINDKRELNEFILSEVVDASKVLIDKIQSVKTITHEDRYNDLLLAILRLRFQIWGWSISDQPRVGDSATGKNAGEADITIEARSRTIALFEGLILKGKSKKVTQGHAWKVFKYKKNLQRYYMVIYFKGKPGKFDYTWTKYEADFSSLKFPSGFELDVKKGFEKLSEKFDDVGHLKIAKSIHGQNVEIFHIMINLSDIGSCPK